MVGLGDGYGTLVDGEAWNGAGDTGRGGGSSVVNNGVKIVTLGESAVGGRLGTLRYGADKLGWIATGGARDSAI